MEQQQLDSKYHKYILLVERILNSFESVNEWADVIAFLGRLLKSFQAYPQYAFVPHKLVVAKRLAQCLNPALPAGVHQKTLEVYEYIFQSIGGGQLEEDLHLYSYGLFPFLQNASTSVKTQLLKIFEKHYLPLGKSLSPCLKSFILALLPGLEEERTELFEKVVALLDKLNNVVGPASFYQAMWLCLISAPPLRWCAINFLSQRMPKIVSLEDVAFLLGSDTGLMVRALSATLDDKDILVQRGILEVLVNGFPLQSQIFEEENLKILMSHAIGVVLRKDMSLNRRLYSWLLGPGEQKQQQEYFEAYTKKTLLSAMREMFFLESANVIDLQRPYKILISLMDKWEIGYPIVRDLLIDILSSLKKHYDGGHHESELYQTANMFISMVEPRLLWSTLYTSMTSDMSTNSILNLIDFVVNYVSFGDAETLRIHFPLFLSLLLHSLKDSQSSEKYLERLPRMRAILEACLSLVKNMSPDQFSEVAFNGGLSSGDVVDGEGEDKKQSKSPLVSTRSSLKINDDVVAFAEKLYHEGRNEDDLEAIGGSELASIALDYIHHSYTSGLEICLQLRQSNEDGDNPLGVPQQFAPLLKELSTLSLTIINGMDIDSSEKSTKSSVVDHIFIEHLQKIKTFCLQAQDLLLLDTVFTYLYKVVKDSRFTNEAEVQKDMFLERLVNELWEFLTPDHVWQHERIVELIWMSHRLSSEHCLPNAVTKLLTPQPIELRIKAFEIFSVFWSHSLNHKESHFVLARSLLIVLGSLQDDEPRISRVAQSWIRSHVFAHQELHQSFLEILTMVLLDPYLSWSSYDQPSEHHTFQFYQYRGRFDEAQVAYGFHCIKMLWKLGGSAFLRVLRNTEIQNETLIERSKGLIDAKENSKHTSYLQVVVDSSLRFLQSEFSSEYPEHVHHLNYDIQRACTDNLFLFVSHASEKDANLVCTIRDTLFGKLLYAIDKRNSELQACLLPLLYITLNLAPLSRESAKKPTAMPSISHAPPVRTETDDDYFDDFVEPSGFAHHLSDTPKTVDRTSLDPLSTFINVMVKAISTLSDSSIIYDWLHFIVVTLPSIDQSSDQIVDALVNCICSQITIIITDIQGSKPSSEINRPSEGYSYSEQITGLLEGLDKITIYALNGSVAWERLYKSKNREPYIEFWDSPYQFSNNTTSNSKHKLREVILQKFFNIHDILYSTWLVVRQNYLHKDGESSGRLESMVDTQKNKICNCLRTFLIRLYTIQPIEVSEAFVAIWILNNLSVITAEEKTVLVDNTSIELFRSVPKARPDFVIPTLLESIRKRAAMSQKGKKPTDFSELNGLAILKYLEFYCQIELDTDSSADIWNYCIRFAREYFHNASGHKYVFPYILRLLTTVYLKLSPSDISERKVHREARDVYQRILDYAILLVGKLFSLGMWSRKSTRESDELIDQYQLQILQKKFSRDLSDKIPEETEQYLKEKEIRIFQNIMEYIATFVLPNLNSILHEQDRITTIFSNLVYYIISPILKNPTSCGHYMEPVLDIILAANRIPFTYKIWRKEVWDYFMDMQFFPLHPELSHKWSKVIQSVISYEKERFAEVLGKITASPSALFSSKEQEMLNRVQMLRRLSFIIFSGTHDQYLAILPTIQEKLVELVKSNVEELVHVEIYLCLRVLLVRISHRHLTNFWPVLLTELIRLFEMFRQKGVENSLQCDLMLAACKFLDLVFTLGTDDFQIHQWIFITDGVDVSKVSAASYGLLEKIDPKISDNSIETAAKELTQVTELTSKNSQSKKPMLCMRKITKASELSFFVKYVSLHVYQDTYSLNEPDMPFIEKLIENDLIEFDE
ncbi:hypothetical protein K7432_000963 [Basidiobolus ranarum]|uniref:Dopey N-terminal domain-containing protein n=1 Tax=Basidiobolus ranarum TaxID=34480 RepID=A0ABR2X3U0_9FUNG